MQRLQPSERKLSDMLEARTQDEAILSDVLARAFALDPVMRWLLPEDATYLNHSNNYFSIAVTDAMKTSSCFTNEARNGVALWTRPSDHSSSLSELISGLRTMWILKSNLPRAYHLQEVMMRYRPRQDFLHLTHLATAPEAQGSGVARQLIEPMLTEARMQGWPIYLECSNQDNLSFYRQFGFRLVDDLSIKDSSVQGPTIWLMTLDP